MLCPACMRDAVVDGVCTVCHRPLDEQQPDIPNVLPLMSIPDGRFLIGLAIGWGSFGITYMGMDLQSSTRVLLCVNKQLNSRVIHLDAVCPWCMRESVRNGVCTECGKPVPDKQLPPNALPLLSILHGHYLVGHTLGHGGFGITYVALDMRDMHKVAIKEYMPNGVSSRRMGECTVTQLSTKDFAYGEKHFIREARTISELQRVPNIIRIEKCFQQFGTSYYAMEFLDGGDLKHYLDSRGGQISFNEAADLLLPVIRCLNIVHEHKVVHRDISPDNIFPLNNGSTKLIDFGAAHSELSQNSMSYQMVLKRGYAPVEQYIPNSVQGPATDVYAVTVTLYRCVSGKLPQESIKRLNGGDTFSPIAQGVPITPAQEQVLFKGMALKAEDRFQTMNALADAIERVKNDQSSQSETVVPPEPEPSPEPTPVPEPQRKSGLNRFFSKLFGGKKAAQTQKAEDHTTPKTTVLSSAVSGTSATMIHQAAGQQNGGYCVCGTQGVFAGKTFAMYSDPYHMGRDQDRCDIVFPPRTPGVSAMHCCIWLDFSNNCVMVEDNESTYGTYVNGDQKLMPHEPHMLHEGDTFRLMNEAFKVVKL